MNDKKLKSVLRYDPETGLFTWLVRTSNRIKVGDVAGSIDAYGYRQIKVFGRIYKTHRLAFLYMTGSFPADQIDHINRIPDDNRWINLRAVSNAENQRNHGIQKNNTSGFMGVCRDKSCNSWRVTATHEGRQIYRNFADSKFGGFNLSLMAAAFYAVRMYSEIGYHPNHGISYQLLKQRGSHAMEAV